MLQLYTSNYDPDYPLVCFDETSKQLISEINSPIAAEPGKSERFDYEYSNSWSYEVQWKANRQIIELTRFL